MLLMNSSWIIFMTGWLCRCVVHILTVDSVGCSCLDSVFAVLLLMSWQCWCVVVLPVLMRCCLASVGLLAPVFLPCCPVVAGTLKAFGPSTIWFRTSSALYSLSLACTSRSNPSECHRPSHQQSPWTRQPTRLWQTTHWSMSRMSTWCFTRVVLLVVDCSVVYTDTSLKPMLSFLLHLFVLICTSW